MVSNVGAGPSNTVRIDMFFGEARFQRTPLAQITERQERDAFELR